MNNRQIDTIIVQLKSTIFALEDLKEKPAASIVKRLEVPWLSQLGDKANLARGDCGTACVAMLANFKGQACTVDDVSRAIGHPFQSLSFDELVSVARTFGVQLVYQHGWLVSTMLAEVEAGRPMIALVNYQSLPALARFQATYNAGHYIVMVGYDDQHIIYHDPNWPTAEGGAFRMVTQAEFNTAYSTRAPGNHAAQHLLAMEAG